MMDAVSRHDAERADSGYALMPFRFLRRGDGSVLVTSECGEWAVLPAAVFSQFAKHELRRNHPIYLDLKAKHFLIDGDVCLPVKLVATKVRTKRSYLAGFTQLHIFVTTLRCNNTCSYCQVSRVSHDRTQFDMSIDTATRAVDWAFQPPAEHIKIEFQGGEPTLNWPAVVHVVNAANARARAEARAVEFVLATNLLGISDEMLEFCAANEVQISTSLDGPADLHNTNRPWPGGDGYRRFRANLARARTILGDDRICALMTTSPASLSRAKDIVDEYVDAGFRSVFLRSISPYGFATQTGLDRACDAARFVEFYGEGLDYIIELNRRGVSFVESYAQILLRKILTPFPVGYVDLQSPAGTVLDVLVYNYDGDVYASDESRMLAAMGDASFRLGSLAMDEYRHVMKTPRVRAIVENSCLDRSWTIQPPDFRLTFRIPNVFGMWAVANF